MPRVSSMYIDTDEKMAQFAQQIQGAQVVSVDFEFDRNRFRYGFTMCLIQLMADQKVYLIDPTRPLDLQPFFEIMESPDITKLVFSFGEDHRLLNKYGCFPKQVIDLKVLSVLLNYENMSLARLLKETIRVELEKTSQKSNWFNRPLSDKQINYAIDDVLYLEELYNSLCGHSQYAKVKDWMLSEVDILDQQDYSSIDFEKPFKETEKKKFNAFQWHIYEAILMWRNEIAERHNMPSYRILDKKEVEAYCRLIQGDGTDQVPQFRTVKSSYRFELEENIFEWLQAAENEKLSVDGSVFDYPFSRMEQKKRKKIFYELKKAYEPVKKQMVNDLGNHTADYFLNNRYLEQLAQLDEQMIPTYKKNLIETYYQLIYDKDPS